MTTHMAAKTMATLGISLALAGCGGSSKDDAESQTGAVSSIQDAGDPFVFVFSTVAQSNLNNAIITVKAKDLEGADPADVRAGDEVKVTVQVCTASIPAQCDATHVEVTGK